MAKRISVVVSQGQSQNPAKRQLEEDLITRLMFEPGVDVTVVPHLYDLKADGTGMLALQGVKGDLVVCSWLFSRAAFWVLDRQGIRGQYGTTTIKAEDEDEEEELEEEQEAARAAKERVVDQREIPNRRIWCLDLKIKTSVEPYLEEVRRIQSESNVKTVDLMGWIQGAPSPESLQRFRQEPERPLVEPAPVLDLASRQNSVQRVTDEGEQRRWYPVIDFSRCTNCMECIDFCLFGVYGVDGSETILVEQPDNCRKGCPACSRVCPENAIMFPQHKNSAIAGSDELAASLKIDLSKLFGAPDAGKSAVDVAVLERDEQLLAAGREAVGFTIGIKAEEENSANRDELDDLLDELDNAEL